MNRHRLELIEKPRSWEPAAEIMKRAERRNWLIALMCGAITVALLLVWLRP